MISSCFLLIACYVSRMVQSLHCTSLHTENIIVTYIVTSQPVQKQILEIFLSSINHIAHLYFQSPISVFYKDPMQQLCHVHLFLHSRVCMQLHLTQGGHFVVRPKSVSEIKNFENIFEYALWRNLLKIAIVGVKVLDNDSRMMVWSQQKVTNNSSVCWGACSWY